MQHRVRRRVVARLDDLTRAARTRSAVGTFLLNSVSPWDSFISKLYFNAGSKVWADLQADATHTAALRAGLSQLAEAPQRILEVGAGAGAGSGVAAELFPDAEIVGIDFAKRMIDRANELHGSDRVRFEVASIQTFECAPFDLVMFLNCTAFPPLLRPLLKPDGCVLVASTFSPRSSTINEVHFQTCGFAPLAWANVDRGSYELYRVEPQAAAPSTPLASIPAAGASQGIP